MNWDNTLRRSFEQIIFNMHDEYEKAVTWLDWGLLDILEYVENEWPLQGRDDHEEMAFCIFRLWWANKMHIKQYQIEDLEKYLWDAYSAIVDLYIAAYHVDDEISSTAAEGRRGILTLAGKEQLQEIATKLITHPEGIFEGPAVDRYNFISARENFEKNIEEYDSQQGYRWRFGLPGARQALRVMRIFVEVDKKRRQASNRYWGKYGELEKYVDHEDREIRERVRELLGILQTPPFVNSRAKPVEEGITMRYYTDGDRTDVDENGELIDWAKTEPGIYKGEEGVPDEDPYDDEAGFEGLGSLFG
jgi:hypothetical protein